MLDKTFVLKGKQEPEWLLVDATGQGIGRLGNPDRRLSAGQTQTHFYTWCR